MEYTSSFNFKLELNNDWEQVLPVTNTMPDTIMEFRHKKVNCPLYITLSGQRPISGMEAFFTYVERKLNNENFNIISDKTLNYKNKFREFEILETDVQNPKTNENEIHFYFQFDDDFFYCGAVKFENILLKDVPQFEQTLYDVLKYWQTK